MRLQPLQVCLPVQEFVQSALQEGNGRKGQQETFGEILEYMVHAILVYAARLCSKRVSFMERSVKMILALPFLSI